MLVSKCCCCCSLKYGFLTFATIYLTLRICLASGLVFEILMNTDTRSEDAARVIGPIFGWLIGTSFALFIAIRGIATKTSILIYPYIVLLIFEICLLIVASIVESLFVSPVLLVQIILVGIDIYAAICLIGLYQQIKAHENNLFNHMPLKEV